MKPEGFKQWFRELVAKIPKEQVKAELAEARAGHDAMQCLVVDLNSDDVYLAGGTIDTCTGVFTLEDPSWETGWCLPALGKRPYQKDVVEMVAVSCGDPADSPSLALAA